MAIKRKCSFGDSPLSISSFGAVSTPDAPSPSPFPQGCDGAMETDPALRSSTWTFMSASRVKSSDWGNRTRKRFRDNRPDERAIHENTLNKLFAAQRDQPYAAPMPTEALSHQSTEPTSRPQKSTLHSFWKQLPAPPVRPLIYPIQALQPQPVPQLPRCEDCDALLQSDGESMDIDMDMDLGSAVEINPFACNDCGKHVCSTCAVMASRRHCLGCATSGTKSSRWW